MERSARLQGRAVVIRLYRDETEMRRALREIVEVSKLGVPLAVVLAALGVISSPAVLSRRSQRSRTRRAKSPPSRSPSASRIRTRMTSSAVSRASLTTRSHALRTHSRQRLPAGSPCSGVDHTETPADFPQLSGKAAASFCFMARKKNLLGPLADESIVKPSAIAAVEF
jgi:hypothetical protein